MLDIGYEQAGIGGGSSILPRQCHLHRMLGDWKEVREEQTPVDNGMPECGEDDQSRKPKPDSRECRVVLSGNTEGANLRRLRARRDTVEASKRTRCTR